MDVYRKRSTIEQKFEEGLRPIIENSGHKLFDLKYQAPSKTLQIFIMDPLTKSATIDDCVVIDRAVTPFFEENDWIDECTLEVSSPGLFRELRFYDHFKDSIGESIQVILKKNWEQLAFEGDKNIADKTKKKVGKKIIGILDSVKTDSILFRPSFRPDQVCELEFNQLSKVTINTDVFATPTNERN